MKSYEKTCADVQELIQELLEEEAQLVQTDIAGVYTQVTADNELALFVQMKDGMTVLVSVG